MKRYLIVVLTTCLITLTPFKSHAIIWTVVKAAAKKVIKAIDLQVQRLQNKTIGLQNAQKVLENSMSKLKLEEISGWVERQREQYAVYYQELQNVRNAIALYRRVREIIQMQVAMVSEYNRAFNLFKRDSHFSAQEISDMEDVYAGMLTESLKNLDQLRLVINSFSSEMSDAKRLEIIASAADKMQGVFTDLKSFNATNSIHSIERAKSAEEVTHLRTLYGIDAQ